MKQLLEKNSDPYLAMLAYRSTPLENGYSPAELLMGRKLRTTLPMTSEQLKPSLPDDTLVRRKEKERMKRNFDKHHRARDLQPLEPGESVWIPENKSSGTVIGESNPRSYDVQTQDGMLRRNRRDLVQMPNDSEAQSDEPEQSNSADQASESQTENGPRSAGNGNATTRSGRVSKPPDRLMRVEHRA